jgi:hypothetical protein
MAHFAELDKDGTVLRVLVIPDGEAGRGEEYLKETLRLGGEWTETSYTAQTKARYAGIGMVFDKVASEFRYDARLAQASESEIGADEPRRIG